MAVVTVQAGGAISDGDIIRNNWYTWANDQYGIMGLSYRCESLIGGPRLGDVAWWLQNNAQVSMQDVIGIPALLLGSRCTIQSPIGTENAGVATSTSIGGLGSTLLPTQTTGIISFKTDVRGPAGRGRMYTAFPGNSASNTTTGLPNDVFVDNLQALASFLGVSQIATSEDSARSVLIRPVVFHRDTDAFALITGATARDYWGTQKRRGDLGRPNPQAIPL